MPKYNIDMTESVYYHVSSVEADSESEAEERVRAMWLNGEITSDDCDLDFTTTEASDG